MATDLQTLVNAIPKAEDGHVITSDYHNSLRAALLAMLDNLGAIKGGAVVQTITPTFFTNKDRSAWVVLNGVAAATDQAKTTSGFLALGLPDGARIQRLTVAGVAKPKGTGPIGSFVVSLTRQAVDKAGTSLTLVTIPLEDVKTEGNGRFVAEGRIESTIAPGRILSNESLIDLTTVDNGKYKYLLLAEADPPFDAIEVHSIQISTVA